MGRCIGTATPTELEHAQRLLTDCHVTAPFAEPDEDEYELWRAGKLVAFYLTELFNAGGHFGPDVDTACLAEEPAVDRWEVGVEYPSWEQTVALARSLDVRVCDLAHPDAEPRHHEVRPRLKVSGLGILSFEPSSLWPSQPLRPPATTITPPSDKTVRPDSPDKQALNWPDGMSPPRVGGDPVPGTSVHARSRHQQAHADAVGRVPDDPGERSPARLSHSGCGNPSSSASSGQDRWNASCQ